MKKIKKPVSILLSLIMALSLFTIVPFTVSAATYSGTDGNISWTFDEATGTLTISGSGDMNDYTNNYLETDAPWFSLNASIRSVIIEPGVTSIGTASFGHLAELTSVSMPDGIERIGDDAFVNCELLTDVTLPDGVESIGEGAFYNCLSITELTIPDSVTSIGAVSFAYTGIVDIIIPGSIKVISGDAFLYCENLNNVMISDGVETISGSAFNSSGIRSISIPESVTSIKPRSFYPANNLEKVVFRGTERHFDSMVYEYEVFRHFTSNTAVFIPSGSTYIKDGETVLIDSGNASEVFGGANVYFTSGTTGDCTWAFDPDTGTLTISGSGGMPEYYRLSDIPWRPFRDEIKKVVIENGITSISNYAFYQCYYLTEVTLPDSLKTIGDYSFYYTALKSLTIPDGVTSIGDSAFNYCKSLTSLTISNSVTSIGQKAFSNCKSLIRVTIPDGVTSIGYEAFRGCDSLESVTIPDSVTDIEVYILMDCPSLRTLIFSWNERTFPYVIFDDNRLDYLSSDVTVYLHEGSTYIDCYDIAYTLTAENSNEVFGSANLILYHKVFMGHSISLNGDIGVNYYLNVSPGAELHFEWYNKTFEHTVTEEDYDAASGYYKVQVNVAAAEMNCPIAATCSEPVFEPDVFSVREYADEILDSESEFSADYIAQNGERMYGLLTDLVTKMLDYGAKAQTRFSITDYELANAGVDYAMQEITADDILTKKSDMTRGLSKLGLTYVGTSVVFLSQTTLRHYYSVYNQELFDNYKSTANFTYGEKGALIYFECSDISAPLLDAAQTFGIGDYEYDFSVLDYCKLVLSVNGKSQANRELAMSTYWYNKAAKAYFYALDEYEDDFV